MRFIILAGFLMIGITQSTAVPLRSLLESGTNTEAIRLGKDVLLVDKKTGPNTTLLLGIGHTGFYQGRINKVNIQAQKEFLLSNEKALVNKLVINVALKCFNLNPQRKAAILTWLDVQNKLTLKNISNDFGPMNLHFIREIDEDGHYWTTVQMQRSGQPGVVPWLNYCKP